MGVFFFFYSLSMGFSFRSCDFLDLLLVDLICLSIFCFVFDKLFQVGDVAVDRKILVVVINGCLDVNVVAG